MPHQGPGGAGGDGPGGVLERPVHGRPEDVLAALATTAETWGAEWEPTRSGGRLLLPVTAGLRRGWLRAQVAVSGVGDQSRLRVDVEERHFALHFAAVVILLLSAAGALLTVAWPFYPPLLPAAPLGAILALGGWFLVVSRLQNSGPEEFLAAVEARLAEPPTTAPDPRG